VPRDASTAALRIECDDDILINEERIAVDEGVERPGRQNMPLALAKEFFPRDAGKRILETLVSRRIRHRQHLPGKDATGIGQVHV
jgi:hypothetical protein